VHPGYNHNQLSVARHKVKLSAQLLAGEGEYGIRAAGR
jgi:hypothetical protein